jgi:hypothetical protein
MPDAVNQPQANAKMPAHDLIGETTIVCWDQRWKQHGIQFYVSTPIRSLNLPSGHDTRRHKPSKLDYHLKHEDPWSPPSSIAENGHRRRGRPTESTSEDEGYVAN